MNSTCGRMGPLTLPRWPEPLTSEWLQKYTCCFFLVNVMIRKWLILYRTPTEPLTRIGPGTRAHPPPTLSGLPWARSVQLCISISMSGLPWSGSVQRGGFLFKEFWTRTVFWPDTCLMCRGPSLMCRGPSLMCRGPSLMFR